MDLRKAEGSVGKNCADAESPHSFSHHALEAQTSFVHECEDRLQSFE